MQESQKIVKKNIYIARWIEGMERYVKFDERKRDYVKVELGAAQQFPTKEEAETFADTMKASGYDRPEIIPVEVKPIA